MGIQGSICDMVEGAEGIVIHNGNIVLGMQGPKRWYKTEENKMAAIIKTLGGKIEKCDENDSRKALIRELLEEVKNIDIGKVDISNEAIFTKKIKIGDLNPYEKESNIIMNADFYLVKISDKKQIKPNDLPVILEIPIDKFLKLEFGKQTEWRTLQSYIIKNEDFSLNLPEYYSLMIPEEVRKFLQNKGDV